MRAETAPRIVDREGEAVVGGVFVGAVVVPEDVIANCSMDSSLYQRQVLRMRSERQLVLCVRELAY